ncbi:hypothetical protein CSKR_110471 [Clonorchis sinensis]|uniref:Uncharacterized protein n=2 Tax=Clonorchis sinensis TaxID=79923 RepID=G7YU26_CLOSI|nr:hypothetical protein CSKR_110471 [Clonorchis sinensis]GAA56456.1 hypothetical protein CLF_110927 [Clonorchis sinensis]
MIKSPSLCALLVTLNIISSANSAETIKCYVCSNCPIPFQSEGARQLGNCNYCRTQYNYLSADRVRIEKDCVVSCVEKDRVHNSQGMKTECCTTNLCNPATTATPSRRILAMACLLMSLISSKSLL